MTPVELLRFLVPADLFQFCFLAIIVCIAGRNILEVRRHANEEYWEAAWGGHTAHTEDDDLDAEHGSITDLSQAVSHKSERWAEIMPGILLVVGLLGTFIGIGIALNKAAGILNFAQGDDTARAVKEMLPMLDGLGTKFKTSTWGIIGFLTFKIWHSRYGTEEKRLRWCIAKSKQQMNQRRGEERLKSETKHHDMIAALRSVGHEMCQVMQSEISLNREILTKKLTESQNSSKIQGQLLAQIHQQGELHGAIKENSFQTVESTHRMSAAVLQFIKTNSASSARMSESSDTIAASAGALNAAIESFSGEINRTLDQVTATLDGSLSNITRTLNDTLSDMSSGFMTTMQTGTDQLNHTINQSSEQLGKATQGIQWAVSSMSENMDAALSEMNHGFVTSMKKGSDDLSEAMENSSSKLSEATGGIRDAVFGMSQDVLQTQQQLQQTMISIGTSMEKMDEKQSKLLSSIQQTTLNMDAASHKSRESINDAVSQLSERMHTVSKSNAEMMGVVRTLNGSIAEFNRLLKESLLGLEPPQSAPSHEASPGVGAIA